MYHLDLPYKAVLTNGRLVPMTGTQLLHCKEITGLAEKPVSQNQN